MKVEGIGRVLLNRSGEYCMIDISSYEDYDERYIFEPIPNSGIISIDKSDIVYIGMECIN